MSKKKRAALYARVSTEAQVENEKSIAAQITEMRNYAEERDWAIVAEYADEGRSGVTREVRAGLKQLMVAVRKGMIDVVVVASLSRFSRSVRETSVLFEELKAHNATFVSAKEKQFDYSDPSRFASLNLPNALNQFYLDVLPQLT